MPGLIAKPQPKNWKVEEKKHTEKFVGKKCKGDLLFPCPKKVWKNEPKTGRLMCKMHWFRYYRYGKNDDGERRRKIKARERKRDEKGRFKDERK